MKKILLSSVVAFGLIGCGPVSEEELPGTEFDLPEQAPVAVSGVIDVLPYFVPSCGGAGAKYYTERGLRRWFVPKGYDGSGRKQFMYVKNNSGADYESMTADGSWIRLWKDTSWAYLSGGTYCDEQCGSTGVPTDCRHQWRNDPTPQGYAYQAPKDTGDWGGAKLMPRYIDTAIITTVNVNLYIDAQRETGSNACGDCQSWHEGSGGQTYTIQYLSSYTNPATGFVYSNVLKKVITGGIGAGEHYYYAYGKGWVGYEVPSAGYRDWVTGTNADVASPVNCTNGTAYSIC
jgi:hypothetical protein